MMRSTMFSVPNSQSSARGPEREKEADDDEMKPDSEYARGRRTGKGLSQDRHQDWEMY